MSFGFGAGADMQKVYQKNNKSLKGKKSLKEINSLYHERSAKKLQYNEMNPEQYELWKGQLEKQLKKERRIKLLVGIFLTIAGTLLLLWIL